MFSFIDLYDCKPSTNDNELDSLPRTVQFAPDVAYQTQVNIHISNNAFLYSGALYARNHILGRLYQNPGSSDDKWLPHSM